MKEYYEFIKDFNCDGILKNFTLSIKDKGNVLGEYFRNEHPIKYLKPGENIRIRYNDNENDFEIRYIKNSYFSNDVTKVLVELFSEIELENMYKDYLESLLTYEFPNDEYATFYPTQGMDYDEIKECGWKIKYDLDFNIRSYFQFKELLLTDILWEGYLSRMRVLKNK